jgi:hypothetical protein
MELLEVAGSEQQQIVIRLEAAWQARLTDLLEENPEAAAELRALVEQASAGRSPSVGLIEQRVTGFDRAQQAVQGHGVQVNTFGGQSEPSQRE